ncbi:MAG: hypothetical protein HC898_07945 [Phycisphaerales bacterium]|nr:hypothetical protein [Phycisphaerales bacterium]
MVARCIAGSMLLAGCLGVPTFGATTAHIALVPVSTSVVVSSSLAVDLWLLDLTSDSVNPLPKVGAIDIEFGGVNTTTTPLRFTPTSDFEVDAGMLALLSMVFDETLHEGYIPGFPDLSFAAGFSGQQGIPADGRDVRIGRLWIESDTPGSFTLSANHSATQALLEDVTLVELTFTDAQFTVTAVPEPASLSVLGLAAGLLLQVRRTARPKA